MKREHSWHTWYLILEILWVRSWRTRPNARNCGRIFLRQERMHVEPIGGRELALYKNILDSNTTPESPTRSDPWARNLFFNWQLVEGLKHYIMVKCSNVVQQNHICYHDCNFVNQITTKFIKLKIRCSCNVLFFVDWVNTKHFSWFM